MKIAHTVISSATREVVIGFDRPFTIIGERINPTGRKLLAQEMKAGDFSRVERLNIAALADVLDIQLRETLREQLGGTYGVQVGASTEREPDPRYSLSIGLMLAAVSFAGPFFTVYMLRELHFTYLEFMGNMAADHKVVAAGTRTTAGNGLLRRCICARSRCRNRARPGSFS